MTIPGLRRTKLFLQVWSARTPSSFKSKYNETIFSEVNPDSETEVKSRLCLPVSSEVGLPKNNLSCIKSNKL